MKPNQARKARRKSLRKAIRQAEFIAVDKKVKAKQKWIKEYYESRGDYPPNKKTKRLTKEQFRKFFKRKSK
jgi:hypothetical protein